MKQDKSPKTFELMLTDYVNGHLSVVERQAFEAALDEYPSLRESLALEQDIKRVVTAAPEDVALPRFASLERRLNQRRFRWINGPIWLVPVAAAMLLAVLVGVNQVPLGDDGDYRTLTDNAVARERDTLRVVFKSAWQDGDEALFVAQYGLVLVHQIDTVNTLEVALPPGTDPDDVAARLREDARVRFVRVIPAGDPR
ncbi:MAG: hypothetical protein AAGF46_11385 [Pseudomonadota bacterium]